MYRPASEREAAEAILSAINLMSSRYEVAAPEEWHAVETAYEDLLAVLEAMGFDPDEDFVWDGRGRFVFSVR